MAINWKQINKKGIFFTYIAIGLVSLIVYSFVIHTGYIYRDSMFVIETRVDTIGSFIKDVETDISRGFYISSFRALLAIEDYIITNNSFIPNVTSAFEEALINSTVLNTSSNMMENASFSDWINKIQLEAQKIDIIFELYSSNLTINQSDSWTINLEMDIIMNISDMKKTASWIRTNHITTQIDIDDFEDPTYSLNTYGKITQRIKKANQTNFENIDVLKEHIQNSYYIESDRAPSFLMRLEGNLSDSDQGIESIVNIDKLIVQSITPKTKSTVDYIYFSNVSPSSCIINKTLNDSAYDWFRLDNNDTYHLNAYKSNCV